MIYRASPLLQSTMTAATLASIKAEIDRQTEVAMTGLDVLDPHDAAGLWGTIFGLQESLSNQDVYGTNAAMAQTVMLTADTALDEATNLMIAAQDLAVQMASETYNDDDRADTAVEIDALIEQMIVLANTSFDGNSVFAGTATDGPAFDASGTYLGNSSIPQTIVGDGNTVQTGLDGGATFTAALDVLTQLAAALRLGPGSSTATAALLPDITAANEGIIDVRTTVGLAEVDAADAEALATSLGLTLQSSLDARVAADPIESLVYLGTLQTAYEIALQVTAQSNQQSLFDFIP